MSKKGDFNNHHRREIKKEGAKDKLPRVSNYQFAFHPRAVKKIAPVDLELNVALFTMNAFSSR